VVGPRDAGVYRVLNAVSDSLPIDERIGRRAGALLGRADHSDTVDAIVVAQAIESGGAEILTGDPANLTALADRASSNLLRCQ
jgi:predicted nucleic acid-binding protein